jgi:hypothetical protein
VLQRGAFIGEFRVVSDLFPPVLDGGLGDLALIVGGIREQPFLAAVLLDVFLQGSGSGVGLFL